MMIIAHSIGAKMAVARRPRLVNTTAIRISRILPIAIHPPDNHAAARTDLVWGIEPVRELITAAPGAIRTLYIRSGDGQRFEDEMDRVRIAGGQVAFADEAEITRNCGRDARHQGIAAVVREYEYLELEDMLEAKARPAPAGRWSHRSGAIWARSWRSAGRRRRRQYRDREGPHRRDDLGGD